MDCVSNFLADFWASWWVSTLCCHPCLGCSWLGSFSRTSPTTLASLDALSAPSTGKMQLLLILCTTLKIQTMDSSAAFLTLCFSRCVSILSNTEFYPHSVVEMMDICRYMNNVHCSLKMQMMMQNIAEAWAEQRGGGGDSWGERKLPVWEGGGQLRRHLRHCDHHHHRRLWADAPHATLVTTLTQRWRASWGCSALSSSCSGPSTVAIDVF